MFRMNRDAVFARIQEDQSKDPVKVILLDRWILSAVVYSAMRFEDVGHKTNSSYFADLVNGERIPNVTLVIEEPGEVIVQRMQYRLERLQGPAPKVWQQSAACYERIMSVFRDFASSFPSSYTYYVTSESIYGKLD